MHNVLLSDYLNKDKISAAAKEIAQHLGKNEENTSRKWLV